MYEGIHIFNIFMLISQSVEVDAFQTDTAEVLILLKCFAASGCIS